MQPRKTNAVPSFLPYANNIDLYGIIMPRCYSDRAADISDLYNLTFFKKDNKEKRNQSYRFSILGLRVFLPRKVIVSLYSFLLDCTLKTGFDWITYFKGDPDT